MEILIFVLVGLAAVLKILQLLIIEIRYLPKV